MHENVYIRKPRYVDVKNEINIRLNMLSTIPNKSFQTTKNKVTLMPTTRKAHMQSYETSYL